MSIAPEPPKEGGWTTHLDIAPSNSTEANLTASFKKRSNKYMPREDSIDEDSIPSPSQSGGSFKGGSRTASLIPDNIQMLIADAAAEAVAGISVADADNDNASSSMRARAQSESPGSGRAKANPQGSHNRTASLIPGNMTFLMADAAAVAGEETGGGGDRRRTKSRLSLSGGGHNRSTSFMSDNMHALMASAAAAAGMGGSGSSTDRRSSAVNSLVGSGTTRRRRHEQGQLQDQSGPASTVSAPSPDILSRIESSGPQGVAKPSSTLSKETTDGRSKPEEEAVIQPIIAKRTSSATLRPTVAASTLHEPVAPSKAEQCVDTRESSLRQHEDMGSPDDTRRTFTAGAMVLIKDVENEHALNGLSGVVQSVSTSVESHDHQEYVVRLDDPPASSLETVKLRSANIELRRGGEGSTDQASVTQALESNGLGGLLHSRSAVDIQVEEMDNGNVETATSNKPDDTEADGGEGEDGGEGVEGVVDLAGAATGKQQRENEVSSKQRRMTAFHSSSHLRQSMSIIDSDPELGVVRPRVASLATHIEDVGQTEKSSAGDGGSSEGEVRGFKGESVATVAASVKAEMERLADNILPAFLSEERAPMVVIPLERWYAAGHFPRSSENLTRPVRSSDSRIADPEDDFVIFVSHRWWGPATNQPDDEEGSKYAIVNRGIQQVVAKYSIPTERVVIWCDYACIDQDDPATQADGIASLISYTARSNLVLTPVQSTPDAIAAYSSASHPTDLVNYGERAWCRLETYIFMCVGEVLMRPPAFYGIGLVLPRHGLFSACLSNKPKWMLRRLAAEYSPTEAIDNILMTIERRSKSSTLKISASASRLSTTLRRSRSIIGIVNGEEEGATSTSTAENNSLDMTVRRNLSDASTSSRSSGRSSYSLSRKQGRSSVGRSADNYSGALFAEAQMPSSGELTKESDRALIREIEEKVLQTYVHFAVLCACILLQLSNPHGVVKFRLHGKQVRSRDLPIVAEQLAKMPFTPRINLMDLSCNLLSPRCVTVLANDILFKMPNLIALDLSENPLLQTDGIRELLPFLEKMNNLEVLGLARCGLTNKAAKVLRYGASKLPDSLANVDLDGNLFDDEGAKTLASLYKETRRQRQKRKVKSTLYISVQHNRRFTAEGYNVVNNAQLESVLVGSGG